MFDDCPRNRDLNHMCAEDRHYLCLAKKGWKHRYHRDYDDRPIKAVLAFAVARAAKNTFDDAPLDQCADSLETTDLHGAEYAPKLMVLMKAAHEALGIWWGHPAVCCIEGNPDVILSVEAYRLERKGLRTREISQRIRDREWVSHSTDGVGGVMTAVGDCLDSNWVKLRDFVAGKRAGS